MIEIRSRTREFTLCSYTMGLRTLGVPFIDLPNGYQATCSSLKSAELVAFGVEIK